MRLAPNGRQHVVACLFGLHPHGRRVCFECFGRWLNFPAVTTDTNGMSLFSDEFPFNRPQRPQTASAPRAVQAVDAADAPATASARNRRRSVRQTLIAKAMLRADDAPAASRPVFVSNISMLGIAFHSRIPLPAGEKYQIKLEAGPMQWASRVRVVSCVENEDGSYDCGAEFVGNELEFRTRAALVARAA
jgi:hypothetical protein